MSLPQPPYGDLEVVDDVPTAFAAVVAAEMAAAAGSPGPFRLALSGGSTAEAAYEQLARDDKLRWDSLECFFGDERCVPADDPDANQLLVRRAFGKRMEALAAFHPMDCGRPGEYAELLRQSGPLDLVHLGLGPDGHTASLFPHSEALSAPEDALVALNADPSGRNPHERMTVTFGCLAQADLAVFTVSGAGKHDALAGVLGGEDLPAARVRSQRVLWLVDREALGTPG